MAKFLRSSGWEIDRTRGSHEVWKSPDGAVSVSLVAHGGKVSPGVVRDVIAKVPNTPDEWK
ncbi:type II toxin-antitoxin system HicA family toxin [Gryllotalpicola koreensis]|uniref:type II toxin-antitoxin system HicA family toxin n=1 Tax=Gryllotalpicola koreensis TaxID=993086 RepID=UPI0031D35AD3